MFKRIDAAVKAFLDPKIIEVEIERRDVLTGLLTRGALWEDSMREFERAKREKKVLSIVFIDLDGLKEVNDTQGHPMGDFYLKEFSKIASKHLRPSDLLVRWGGDEFLILMYATEKEVAITMNRIKGLFANFSWGSEIWSKKNELKKVIANADEAMYKMKREKKKTPT